MPADARCDDSPRYPLGSVSRFRAVKTIPATYATDEEEMLRGAAGSSICGDPRPRRSHGYIVNSVPRRRRQHRRAGRPRRDRVAPASRRLLLARHPRTRRRRPRAAARRVRLPPHRAGGFGALRPAPEAGHLRRLRDAGGLRREPRRGRPRGGALLPVRALPRDRASRRLPCVQRPAHPHHHASPAHRRRGLRPVRRGRCAGGQLLPSAQRVRRAHRRGRGPRLRGSGRRPAAGDLRHQAHAREPAQGDRSGARPLCAHRHRRGRRSPACRPTRSATTATSTTT